MLENCSTRPPRRRQSSRSTSSDSSRRTRTLRRGEFHNKPQRFWLWLRTPVCLIKEPWCHSLHCWKKSHAHHFDYRAAVYMILLLTIPSTRCLGLYLNTFAPLQVINASRPAHSRISTPNSQQTFYVFMLLCYVQNAMRRCRRDQRDSYKFSLDFIVGCVLDLCECVKISRRWLE